MVFAARPLELLLGIGVEGRGSVEVEEGEPGVVEGGEIGGEAGGVGGGLHGVDGEGVEVAGRWCRRAGRGSGWAWLSMAGMEAILRRRGFGSIRSARLGVGDGGD